MLPSLKERLSKELIAIFPEGVEVKVVAPPERRYSVWVGGSIFASLKTFGSEVFENDAIIIRNIVRKNWESAGVTNFVDFQKKAFGMTYQEYERQRYHNEFYKVLIGEKRMKDSALKVREIHKILELDYPLPRARYQENGIYKIFLAVKNGIWKQYGIQTFTDWQHYVFGSEYKIKKLEDTIKDLSD